MSVALNLKKTYSERPDVQFAIDGILQGKTSASAELSRENEGRRALYSLKVQRKDTWGNRACCLGLEAWKRVTACRCQARTLLAMPEEVSQLLLSDLHLPGV